MKASKKVSLLIVLLIMSIIIAACGGNNGNNNAASGSDGTNNGGAEAGTNNAGEDGDSGKAVTISFWNPFSGGDGEFMKTMIAKFQQDNPNIKVEDLTTESGDYYTRLQTAMAAAEAPDVAVVHAARMQQFITNGQLTDLTDLASEAGVNWADYNQNVLENTVFEGKNLAVPLDTHGMLMFYNKTHLKTAGVLDEQGNPIIEPGAEGYKAFLQKIKDAVPADVAPLAQPNVRIDGLWMFWSFYNQLNDGGAMYNEDGTGGAMNNPAALKALKYMDELYKSQLIPPNIDDAFGMFLQGKAATIITGTWGTGAFENKEAVDLGVAQVPVVFDKAAAWADSHTLALPVQNKPDKDKQMAALKFADYIAHNSQEWAKAGHIPAVTSVSDSEEFKAMPFRSSYVTAADTFAFWPKHEQHGAVNRIIEDEIVRMMQNQQNAEETLKRIDAGIEEQLAN